MRHRRNDPGEPPPEHARILAVAVAVARCVGGGAHARAWDGVGQVVFARGALELRAHEDRVQVSLVGDGQVVGFLRGPELDASDRALITEAHERARARLSFESLRLGDRLRVIRDVGTLRAGMLVRFVGYDDVDNHFGRQRFEDEDGTYVVEGDFSSATDPCTWTFLYVERVGTVA